MTYNIRHGLGSDYVQSLDRIRDVIRESNADVVFLQEVNSGIGRNPQSSQAKWLASECGYEAAYADNWRIWRLRGMGNAILSRYPTYSTWNTRLPFAREPRGLLETWVRLGGLEVRLLATHWGLHAGERMRQSRRCVEVVTGSERGGNLPPTILCGDLNVTQDAPEVRGLVMSSGLVDTWPDGPPTYAAAEPSARIDYVFASPHWQVLGRRRIDSIASDHFPVLVELALGELAAK